LRIKARYYPFIIIAAFVVFMLIGFLLGFLPGESGGHGHGRGVLMQFTCLTLGTLI